MDVVRKLGGGGNWYPQKSRNSLAMADDLVFGVTEAPKRIPFFLGSTGFSTYKRLDLSFRRATQYALRHMQRTISHHVAVNWTGILTSTQGLPLKFNLDTSLKPAMIPISSETYVSHRAQAVLKRKTRRVQASSDPAMRRRGPGGVEPSQSSLDLRLGGLCCMGSVHRALMFFLSIALFIYVYSSFVWLAVFWKGPHP